MRKLSLALTMGVLLVSIPAWAATVRLDLAWSVTNTPTVPATNYKIEELVAGAWVTVATVPSTQLTYSIPGRAVGQTFSFSVVPLNGTYPGTRSNTSVCGSVASPTTTLTFSCTASVIP